MSPEYLECTYCDFVQTNNRIIALNLEVLHLKSCLEVEKKHTEDFFYNVNNMFKSKIFMCLWNFCTSCN